MNNLFSNQILALPCVPTARSIFKDFSYQNVLDTELTAITTDLINIFDYISGLHLLYYTERHIYKAYREKFTDKPRCDIFGATHLLRFFGTIFKLTKN